MSDLRDAARQALEALETVFMPHHPAVIALKAALAEEALQRLTDANQEIEAALEQEPVPKSTWQKLYEAAIDQRNEAVAELRRLHAENVLLHERHHFDNGVLCELLQALKEATDAIEHWGSYSSDYFQQKWDLQSDINAARAAIARTEGQA
jgi:tetratricopeptide (TPR) repeat protein